MHHRKNAFWGSVAARGATTLKLSAEEIAHHIRAACIKAQNDALAFEDVFTRDSVARPFSEREVTAVLNFKEQCTLEDRVFVLLSRLHNPRSYGSVGTLPNSDATKLALELFSAANILYQSAFPSALRKPAVPPPPGPEKLREAVGKICDCLLEGPAHALGSIPILLMAVLRKGQLCGCLSSLLHKRDIAFLTSHTTIYFEVMKLVKLLAEHDDLKLLMLDPVKNSLPCLADAVRAVGKEARSLLESASLGYGSRLQDPKFKKMAQRVRSVYKIVKKAVRPVRKGHGGTNKGSSDEDESGMPGKHPGSRSGTWTEPTSNTPMDSPLSMYSLTYGGVPHPRSMPTVKENTALNHRALNKSLPDLGSVLSAHKQQQQLRSMQLNRSSYDASSGVPPLRLGLMSDSVSSLYSPTSSFRSIASSDNGQAPAAPLLSATDSWHSACSSGLSPTAGQGSNTFFNPTFSPPRSRPGHPGNGSPTQDENAFQVPTRRYSLEAGHHASPAATRTAPMYSSFSNPLAGLTQVDGLSDAESAPSDDELPEGHAPYTHTVHSMHSMPQGLSTVPDPYMWDRSSPVLMRSLTSKAAGHNVAHGGAGLRGQNTVQAARPATHTPLPLLDPSLRLYDAGDPAAQFPTWADPGTMPGTMGRKSVSPTPSSGPLDAMVVTTKGPRPGPWQLQDSDVSVTYSSLPTTEPMMRAAQRMPMLSSVNMHSEVCVQQQEVYAQPSESWQPRALMMPFAYPQPAPSLMASMSAALRTAPASFSTRACSPLTLGGAYGNIQHPSQHPHGVDSMGTHIQMGLVGPITDLSVAIIRYQDTYPMLADKLVSLSGQFPRYRSIVGDGNCFYRAFLFGLLEQLMASADQAMLQNLRRRLVHVWKLVSHFPELAQDTQAQQGHLLLVKILSMAWFNSTKASIYQSESTYTNELEAVLRNSTHSDALVQYVRVVTAAEMMSSEEEYSPFVAGCDGERANMSIAALCAKYVVRMDQEAEELQIIALVRALDVCCGILDVAHTEVMFVKHPSTRNRPLFWLLHSPGHYDLVYPRHTCDVHNGMLVHA